VLAASGFNYALAEKETHTRQLGTWNLQRPFSQGNLAKLLQTTLEAQRISLVNKKRLYGRGLYLTSTYCVPGRSRHCPIHHLP
jgi:hypothetical protein